MKRRTLTLLLGTLLAFALALAAAAVKVPYVALGPGPAYDTLGTVRTSSGTTPLLAVTGRATYPTTGQLDLTTVGVTDGITLAEALRGWLSPGTEVVPREVLFPPTQSPAEVDKQNQADMVQSQSSATTAALTQLGIAGAPYVAVGSVAAGGPASGKLQAGDVLSSVDGVEVSTPDQLRTRISARSAGAPVTINYLRKGVRGSAVLTTGRSTDTPVRAVIGITPMTGTTSPVKVAISLQDVGGPSAGLMFALGIVDKLTPGPLTGGRHIAGTGEISDDGKVGPIGGIAEKMIGAKRRGATVFLVPAANCADAKASRPDGLQLVKVGTLAQALDGLRVLVDGGTPVGC